MSVRKLSIALLIVTVFLGSESFGGVEITPPNSLWGKSIERTESNNYFQNSESKQVYDTLDFDGKRNFYQVSKRPYYYVDILDFRTPMNAKNAFLNLQNHASGARNEYITINEVFFQQGAGFDAMWRSGKYILHVVAPTIREVQIGIEAIGY